MPALYSVEQHPLLSEDVLALDEFQLEAQTMTAIMALGLEATNYTDEAQPGDDIATTFRLNRLTRVKNYVARQVNLQVAIDGNHPDPNVGQETHGSETWIYRGNVVLDALALQGVETLADEALGDEAEGEFRAVTSFR